MRMSPSRFVQNGFFLKYIWEWLKHYKEETDNVDDQIQEIWNLVFSLQ